MDDDKPAAPNRAARWARMLTLRSQRRGNRAGLILFGFVFFGWLLTTSIGSYEASVAHGSESALADAVYGPLVFLTPQEGFRHGETGIENPELRAGRFFGVALPVLTLLWAALHWSSGSIARWLLRRHARGQIVIVARGGFADGLAKASAAEGECVALLEASVPDGRAAELARAGVLVIAEEASLGAWLERAGARRAGALAAWSASDSWSLADALAACDDLAGAIGEVVVHVETPETQRSLRHAPGLLERREGRLRPLSIANSAVRAAITDARLVADAVALGRDRVTVAVHGRTVALRIAASLVLRHNWSIHLAAPQIRYTAGDAAWWEGWRRHNDSFLDHAGAVLGVPGALLFGAMDDDGAITRHIIDLGEDDRTLAAAFDLASRLAQRHAAPPRVQAVLRDTHAAHALIEQANASLPFAEPVLIDMSRSLAELLARREDAEAAQVHLAYAAKFGGGGLIDPRWRRLAETFVHASRAGADHIAIKRFDVEKALAQGIAPEELARRLAIAEHDRWSAERLLDGWAPGPRDNDRLLHDKLVPWDALDVAEQEKDFDQVRWIMAQGSGG